MIHWAPTAWSMLTSSRDDPVVKGQGYSATHPRNTLILGHLIHFFTSTLKESIQHASHGLPQRKLRDVIHLAEQIFDCYLIPWLFCLGLYHSTNFQKEHRYFFLSSEIIFSACALCFSIGSHNFHRKEYKKQNGWILLLCLNTIIICKLKKEIKAVF